MWFCLLFFLLFVFVKVKGITFFGLLYGVYNTQIGHYLHVWSLSKYSSPHSVFEYSQSLQASTVQASTLQSHGVIQFNGFIVVTIPVLSDNYSYLIVDLVSRYT